MFQLLLLKSIPDSCLPISQAINHFSRHSCFTFLFQQLQYHFLLIQTTQQIHAHVSICINTSSSTSMALLQEAVLTPLYTSHSAVVPHCCMKLSKANIDENPHAAEDHDKFSVHFLIWKSSQHNQGHFARLQIRSYSIRFHAEACVSCLYWPGSHFSSNPSEVVYTILFALQRQVKILEEYISP